MSAAASGPTQLSNSTPTRLIQSTGNLYWSWNAVGEVGPSERAIIFRASKSSRPGEEVSLYAETGVDFEALTFAEVGGEFYGYFVANYSNTGVSQIKRIPLAGGPAVVLANAPSPIGDSDLVTDGSFLYWADGEGIRSMPIGGGGITTLVAGTTFQHLSVFDGTLYYIAGNAILSVPTRGGTPSTVVGDQPSPITALHVYELQLAKRSERPGPPPSPRPGTAVVWGRNDGGVYSMFLGGKPTTIQEPHAHATVMSVYSDDTRTLWSNQDLEAGTGVVRMAYGGATTTLSSGIPGLVNDVLADDVAAYWTGAFVEKYTF
jgi:hypothetical protein